MLETNLDIIKKNATSTSYLKLLDLSKLKLNNLMSNIQSKINAA